MVCLPGRVGCGGGLAKALPVGVSVGSVLLRDVLKSSQSLEYQCWKGTEKLSSLVVPKLGSSEPWVPLWHLWEGEGHQPRAQQHLFCLLYPCGFWVGTFQKWRPFPIFTINGCWLF